MSPRVLRGIAITSLVALLGVSAAFALAPVRGMAPAYVLALGKLAALAFLLARIARGDVYTMQWSSMFILLFMAEGLVRATSDPQPSAALGALEAAVAIAYFGAVLAFLRPLKQAARRNRRGP